MSVQLKREDSIVGILSGSFSLDTLYIDVNVAVEVVLQLALVERTYVSGHFYELRLDKADLVLFHKLKFELFNLENGRLLQWLLLRYKLVRC